DGGESSGHGAGSSGRHRFGGRRQVDADRTAPLRLQADIPGPVGGDRRGVPTARHRLPRSRPPHRRSASRTVAVEHDRRRLPLLRARVSADTRPVSAMSLLVARHSVLALYRRHAFLASLLRVPHIVQCVNKMDLVDWSQDRYDEIVAEFRHFASRLTIHDLRFVPISALLGDNVVEESNNMPWYNGPSVLHLLEEIHIGSDRNMIDCRFPVQYEIGRAHV